MAAEFTQFYRAGALLDGSSITDVSFSYRVPRYRCSACNSDSNAFHLGYPHLDPRDVLDQNNLKVLKDSHQTGDEVVLDCIRRLEAQFGVFVSAGSYFGPVKLKVSYKLKFDFDILPFTFDFFATRSAAEALKEEGFGFDYVDVEANGKYAKEADFVQMITPVVAYGSLPEGGLFCSACKRKSGPRMPIGYVPSLYNTSAIYQFPFFKTLNSAYLVFSPDFVRAANRLGLTGLKEGSTIFPMPVIDDPQPNRPVISWNRPLSLGSVNQRIIKQETSNHQIVQKKADSVMDLSFANRWADHVKEFICKVKPLDGQATFKRGSGSGFKEEIAQVTVPPLQILMNACGGKLSFDYAIKIENIELSGYLDLSVRRLKTYAKDCRQWAEETWIAEEPEEKEIWLKATPFAALLNGDYLALDGRHNVENPAVVYLSHDDSSQIISPSLREFLQEWEQIFYVGPEIWKLERYIDSKSGFLSADTESAVALKSKLGAALNN